MKQDVARDLTDSIQSLFGVKVSVVVTRPDEQFGDYASNVALQLGKQLQKNPRDIAEALATTLREHLADQLAHVAVEGPGFINLTLRDESLVQSLETAPSQVLTGQNIVAEYSDPNPFKVLHAGHLYTTIVGNAIAHLIEAAGGTVHRVNFGGDVGMHVAKTMWGIMHRVSGDALDARQTRTYIVDDVAQRPLSQRATFMAECYVQGNNAYDDDEAVKRQITAFNKQVYELHASADHSSDFAQIYWTCREWSYQYFEAFYKDLGVSPFEKYYPESETAPLGLETVKEQLKHGVYQESDGAIVFHGERYGLHTRVFVNSHGLPTYEAKDVGLIMKKWQDYHFDLSIIITGNDIVEYMKVVLKSIEQFAPELAEKSKHLTHGQVKLEGGVKMSSRKGNILYATDILQTAQQAASEIVDQHDKQTAYSAVKYAFLKQRLGGDVVYNPQESVSLEGNSGPYIQYAYARAHSILRKAGFVDNQQSVAAMLRSMQADNGFEPGERSLVRKIAEYTEVLDEAVNELMPHSICTYLYELAQTFNRFYEHNRVVGDAREQLRLLLVERYAATLKAGLEILGIAAPEKM